MQAIRTELVLVLRALTERSRDTAMALQRFDYLTARWVLELVLECECSSWADIRVYPWDIQLLARIADTILPSV